LGRINENATAEWHCHSAVFSVLQFVVKPYIAAPFFYRCGNAIHKFCAGTVPLAVLLGRGYRVLCLPVKSLELKGEGCL
jgi:hypothetical protein